MVERETAPRSRPTKRIGVARIDDAVGLAAHPNGFENSTAIMGAALEKAMDMASGNAGG